MPNLYVDGAVGDNANAGTSEGAGNAWATIQYAEDNHSAGDHVYIKGSATYNEMVTLAGSGTSSVRTVFEGYTTTPGDGGQITIDAQSTRASGVTDGGVDSYDNRHWKNIIVENATADGWRFQYPRFVSFENCESNDNADYGFYASSYTTWFRCSTSGNGGRGFYASGTTPRFIFCSSTADQYGYQMAYTPGILLHCIIAGATSVGFYGGNYHQPVIIINSTIDGNAKDSTHGINLAASAGQAILVNNIIYDCQIGIISHASQNMELQVGHNNLLNNNTTDYSTWDRSDDDVTGAPEFTDEASGDYTLQAGSAARNAGFDFAGASPGMDIGAHQTTDPIVVTG